MTVISVEAEASRSLAARLEGALRGLAFENRLSVMPRRLPQLTAELAASFAGFQAGDEDHAGVRAFGRNLAGTGMGHGSILVVVEVLHHYADELGQGGVAARYCTPLLGGYMEAREEHLLREQERTRLALERARAQTAS